MRCVIQKVTHAEVVVEGESVGRIKDGYMVLSFLPPTFWVKIRFSRRVKA